MEEEKNNSDSIKDKIGDFKEHENITGNESSEMKEDNSIYNEIFKEMLYLENSRNIKYRIKYCLVKLSIKNIEDIMSVVNFSDKKKILMKFSDILFYKLRKTKLFRLAKPGNYLILFFDANIENLNLAFNEVEKLANKEFGDKFKLQWNIIKTTEKEEEIKPLLNESELITKVIDKSQLKKYPGISIDLHPSSSDVVVVRSVGIKSMFKYFIISYLIFFSIITIIGVIAYLAEQKFSFIPAGLKFGEIIAGLHLGFLNYFNSQFATIIFFIIIGLAFSVVFGLIGMLIGWIMNISLRISGGIDVKLRD